MPDLTRRQFLCGAAAGAAVVGCAPAPESGERPPNILFLLTDDQRWDTLSVAGNPVLRTPAMDALAGRGVRFLNHFVTTSICAVSRASFFTGLYARCHGIHGFQGALTPEQHAYSYPGRLRQEAGYRTGFIGKYGVGGQQGAEDAAARFDYFEGWPGQGQYLVEGRAHMTEHLGNQAVEFLDGSSVDRPWNLSISFKAPHVQDRVPPYFLNDPKYDELYADVEIPPFPHMDGAYYESLPEALRESENRRRWEQRFPDEEAWAESVRRYYRLIHGVDVQIARLMGELESRGMLDNTVVILAGDNGFYLGERGFAGKWYMHEESIRTPLIVADPRRTATAGTTREEMALNLDVAPTILSLAGLEIPASMNGRDLTPLLAGETPAWRSEWFYEHLFDHAAIPKSEGVRTRDWKYFRFPELEPMWEELYHLAEDPQEDFNLIGKPEYEDELATMRTKTEAWIASLEGWTMNAAWSEPETPAV